MPGAALSEPPEAPIYRPTWRTFWHRRRVIVFDESMVPTLRPGDRLWVDRAAYRRDRSPTVGEIVVVVDPEEPTRWLVKRVSSVDLQSGAITVRGDATASARDSRRFGPVPLRSLIGRVYRLYFPPSRRREF